MGDNTTEEIGVVKSVDDEDNAFRREIPKSAWAS